MSCWRRTQYLRGSLPDQPSRNLVLLPSVGAHHRAIAQEVDQPGHTTTQPIDLTQCRDGKDGSVIAISGDIQAVLNVSPGLSTI